MSDLQVVLEGPFFRGDPSQTFLENVEQMMERLGEELERDVRQEIESHRSEMPYWTGYTDEHVMGYVVSPKTGRHWRFWTAVALPTEGMDARQARRTKAAGALIEKRFHPFRHAKDAVYRARAILSADLAKGLD